MFVGLMILFILCTCIVVVGIVMLLRGLGGGRAILTWNSLSIDAHVGAVLVALGVVGAVCAYSFYAPQVEAENTRLMVEKKQVEDALVVAKGEIKKKEDELASTKGALTSETARAKDRAAENVTLAKQLAHEESRRREAQQQVRNAWGMVDVFGLSDQQRAEFDSFRKGVLALNGDLTLLRISEAFWPRIEGRKAVAIFEIYQKVFEAEQTSPRGAGLFDFHSEKYIVKGDHQGRIAEELRTQIAGTICQATARAFIGGISLRDAVSAMPSISGYDVDTDFLQALAEFQYVLMRLKLLAGEARVLVRGYADGELGRWQHNLDPSRRTVQLHENTKPHAPPAEYALGFRSQLTQVALGRPETKHTMYGNEDLPNLRAAETAAIVTVLVNGCPTLTLNTSVGKIMVEMLEGQVYPHHREVDRKARVHLLIYLKEP